MSQPSFESIQKARENIMNALFEFYAVGKRGEMETKTIAAYAGYSNITSKHVRTALKQLKDSNFIRQSKGMMEMTEKGAQSMPKPEQVPSNHAMQTKLLAMLIKESAKAGANLPPPEKIVALFNILLDGEVHEKKALAKRVGYSHDTKAFRNVIARMKAWGMLTGTSKVTLTNMAFPVEKRGEPFEPLSVSCSLTKEE